jgi:predicted RNase H-like HicB family nuclease
MAITNHERIGKAMELLKSGLGAHSQGATIDELHRNLEEVAAMLLEDGEPAH